VIASYEHSSLFGLIVSNKGKKFSNTDSRTTSTASTTEAPPAPFKPFFISDLDEESKNGVSLPENWKPSLQPYYNPISSSSSGGGSGSGGSGGSQVSMLLNFFLPRLILFLRAKLLGLYSQHSVTYE
jgi:hypothetical protein